MLYSENNFLKTQRIVSIGIQLGLRNYPLKHNCLELNQRLVHHAYLDGLLNTISNYKEIIHNVMQGHKFYTMQVL